MADKPKQKTENRYCTRCKAWKQHTIALIAGGVLETCTVCGKRRGR